MLILITPDGRQNILGTTGGPQRFELTHPDKRAEIYQRVERLCSGAETGECQPVTPAKD